MNTVTYEAPQRTLDTREICDEESRLWLMRMCIGEGGAKCTSEHAAAMLLSLLTRYLLHPWKNAWDKGFIVFVRAFSQPINPRWQEGGDLAKKHKSSKTVLARRKKICSLSMDKISDTIISIVDGFVTGKWAPTGLPNADRISNW